jgi:predicted secreted hydrolase
LTGTGWLDHEWSNSLMPPDAVGWDWIGINLLDGGALTASVMRRRDGSVLWAGGSHRPAGGAVRSFGPDEVIFSPRRYWTSPRSGARYPVEWDIRTPLGEHRVMALLDAQELDSSASTGAVYWEGLSALQDSAGRRIGLGYLEMTGRSTPLRLG